MLGFEEFRKWVEFKVGDGSWVHFWADICYGDQCLGTCFLLLFGLAVNKNAVVVDYVERTGGFIFWNVVLRRPLQDWEVGVLYVQRGLG